MKQFFALHYPSGTKGDFIYLFLHTIYKFSISNGTENLSLKTLEPQATQVHIHQASKNSYLLNMKHGGNPLNSSSFHLPDP